MFCGVEQGETHLRSPLACGVRLRWRRETCGPEHGIRPADIFRCSTLAGNALISVSCGLAEQDRPQAVNRKNLLFPLNKRICALRCGADHRRPCPCALWAEGMHSMPEAADKGQQPRKSGAGRGLAAPQATDFRGFPSSRFSGLDGARSAERGLSSIRGMPCMPSGEH